MVAFLRLSCTDLSRVKINGRLNRELSRATTTTTTATAARAPLTGATRATTTTAQQRMA